MIFFSLFSTALSSIFYGLVITAVVMALLYAILRYASKGIVQTPVFFVTGAVLSVLLLIQTSLMVGAMQAKDAADAAEIYLNQLLENSYGTVSAQDSQKVMDAVTDEFPIIGSFIDMANFAGHDVQDLASSMYETMVDYLSSYIWHRVWWIIGIIVVACVVVVVFEKPRNSSSQRTSRAVPSRQERSRARPGTRSRVNRRR